MIICEFFIVLVIVQQKNILIYYRKTVLLEYTELHGKTSKESCWKIKTKNFLNEEGLNYYIIVVRTLKEKLMWCWCAGTLRMDTATICEWRRRYKKSLLIRSSCKSISIYTGISTYRSSTMTREFSIVLIPLVSSRAIIFTFT